MATAPAGDAGDAVVAAMAAGGVDLLFFTSGSDIAALQEAVARRTELGLQTPRIVTALHETVGLNAAMGYAMVSGRPGAVAVHTDVGVLNMGAALHTAKRNGHALLLLAGSPATAATGSMRGARDHSVFWLQEPRDLREVVAPYVKWAWRLQLQDDPGVVVGRALQVARTEPAGPAFVALPREALLAARPESWFPTAERLGLPTVAYPDPGAIDRLADALVGAACPVVVTGRSGRDPATVPLLVELAESVGAYVTDAGWRERLNFPSRHALLETGPQLGEADVVLVLDRAVPWAPGGAGAPGDGCFVAWMSHDPVVGDVALHEFQAPLRITCDPRAGLEALAAAVQQRLTPAVRDRASARLERGRERRAELDHALAADLARAAGEAPFDAGLVAHHLCELLDDDAILLDESLSNAPALRARFRGTRPGSWFAQSGSAGGWGSGAALGAKLAAPGRDVVLVSGDGFYTFGVPGAALWSALHEGAPYLAVVLVNGRYSTGTRQVAGYYPGGFAERAGFPGGRFEPPPDFAADARAAGAFGEHVEDPAAVRPALQRGLEATRNGSPAVVAVRVA